MPSWDIRWQHEQSAIFWIAVTLAALIIVYFWKGRRNSTRRRESPEETLKRRFARGEMDEKTYERMLDELRK